MTLVMRAARWGLTLTTSALCSVSVVLCGPISVWSVVWCGELLLGSWKLDVVGGFRYQVWEVDVCKFSSLDALTENTKREIEFNCLADSLRLQE